MSQLSQLSQTMSRRTMKTELVIPISRQGYASQVSWRMCTRDPSLRSGSLADLWAHHQKQHHPSSDIYHKCPNYLKPRGTHNENPIVPPETIVSIVSIVSNEQCKQRDNSAVPTGYIPANERRGRFIGLNRSRLPTSNPYPRPIRDTCLNCPNCLKS